LPVDKKRTKNMQAIRAMGNKSTELKMVKLFRENNITGWRRHLPLLGKPDFTFRKEKLTLFVDGCFWHRCPKCYREPRTNAEFWKNKIENNVKRDRRVTKELKQDGWSVFRLWECQLKKPQRFLTRIQKKLEKA
jgi:DNA mismatch endonuclease (patch repair protein)